MAQVALRPHEVSSLPRLAWLAVVPSGGAEVHVYHGPGVEVSHIPSRVLACSPVSVSLRSPWVYLARAESGAARENPR